MMTMTATAVRAAATLRATTTFRARVGLWTLQVLLAVVCAFSVFERQVRRPKGGVDPSEPTAPEWRTPGSRLPRGHGSNNDLPAVDQDLGVVLIRK
jgi:hypothetical protein